MQPKQYKFGMAERREKEAKLYDEIESVLLKLSEVLSNQEEYVLVYQRGFGRGIGVA